MSRKIVMISGKNPSVHPQANPSVHPRRQRPQCAPSKQPQCTPRLHRHQCAPPSVNPQRQGPSVHPPVCTRSFSQACSMSDPNAWAAFRSLNVHQMAHNPLCAPTPVCTRADTARCTPTQDQPQCAIDGRSTQQVFLKIVTLYWNFTSRIKCDGFRNPKV